jgi:hypothetical protein
MYSACHQHGDQALHLAMANEWVAADKRQVKRLEMVDDR